MTDTEQKASSAMATMAQKDKGALADLGVQVVASFAAAVASGTSFTDALKTISPSLTNLQKAYQTLGLDVDDVALKNLMMQNSIMTANPKLVGAIAGLHQEMQALGQMGVLDLKTFEAMERTGKQMYEQLQAQVKDLGGTDKDALGQMQQFLHDAEDAAKKLGQPLDDNTQKLIDQSKEAGIWQDAITPQDKLLNAMQSLVDKVTELVNKLSGIPAHIDTTIATHYVTDGTPPSLPDASAFLPGDQYNQYGSTGGMVTAHGIQYFGAGGTVLPFRPMGTDTVPAMLTPGEMVLTRSQQRALASSRGSVVDFSEMKTELQALRKAQAEQTAWARRLPAQLTAALTSALQQSRVGRQ
jgi:hypothetical protein